MSPTPVDETSPRAAPDYRVVAAVMLGLVVLVFGGLIAAEHRGQRAPAATPTAAPVAAVEPQQTATWQAIAAATVMARATERAQASLATATPGATSASLTRPQLEATLAANATPATLRTPTPVPSPTVQASDTPTARPDPAAVAYHADFSRWPTRTPEGPTPARVTYDAASGSYTIALTDATRQYTHWEYAPEGAAFGDFALDVDAREITGPPHGVWGILFRAQPQASVDKTNPSYDLIVDPGAQEIRVLWTSGDGVDHRLAAKTVSAIHQGDSSNHLQLRVKGDKITVSINNELVGTATGREVKSGAIGLIVANPKDASGPIGMAVVFSHLTVAPLP